MKRIQLTKAPLVEPVKNAEPQVDDEVSEDVLDEESYVLMTPKSIKVKVKIRSVKKSRATHCEP